MAARILVAMARPVASVKRGHDLAADARVSYAE